MIVAIFQTFVTNLRIEFYFVLIYIIYIIMYMYLNIT